MIKFLALFFLITSSLWSVEILCPKESLLVDEIPIAIEGLEAGERVRIELSTIMGRFIKRASFAQFVAGADGAVRLDRDAPLEGTYEGVDSMGLFWSMEQKNVLWYEAIADEPGWFGPFVGMELKVLSEEGDLLAQQMLERHFFAEDVEEFEVDEDGLVGTLYLPEGRELCSVVIVLTGSNGGVPEVMGAMFAAQGIPALALAYTGVGDLPPTVADVQIEYFETAFAWVEKHPRLNGRVALHGTSRGAELALLLASMFPERIERIVAKAPSCVVLSKDSWFYGGEVVLPAAPYFIDLNNDDYYSDGTKEKPTTLRRHRERGFYADRDKFDAAMIPVEKIQCPVMLISGGDDQLGPCTAYSQMVIDRLKAHGSSVETIHLDYPFAGHLISIPYFPRDDLYAEMDGWWNYGGTPYYNEMASRDSWNKTVAFLKEWVDE